MKFLFLPISACVWVLIVEKRENHLFCRSQRFLAANINDVRIESRLSSCVCWFRQQTTSFKWKISQKKKTNNWLCRRRNLVEWPRGKRRWNDCAHRFDVAISISQKIIAWKFLLSCVQLEIIRSERGVPLLKTEIFKRMDEKEDCLPFPNEWRAKQTNPNKEKQTRTNLLLFFFMLFFFSRFSFVLIYTGTTMIRTHRRWNSKPSSLPAQIKWEK